MKILEIAKELTPRGLGVKVSKDPSLKKELLQITNFLPEDIPQSIRIWCVKNGILSEDRLPKCPVCGNLPAYSTGKFSKYCSKRCSQLDKEKFLKKYGVEHHLKSENVKKKRKETVLNKYGVDNIGKITREKAKQTTIKRYGVDNYTKTAEYRQKRVETSLKKYGVSHPMQYEPIKLKQKKSLEGKRKEIYEKVKKTLIFKYGVSSPMYINSVKHKVLEGYKKKVWRRLVLKLDKNGVKPLFDFDTFKEISVKNRDRYQFLCKSCNTKFLDHLDNGHIPVCPNCFKNISNPERIIISFLKENGFSFETNNRVIIKPFEIDIYIPKNKIGIEVNGIYFHTFEKLIEERGLTEKQAKNYHRLKWILANKKSIRLIQFWDTEILRKRNVVFSIIGSALDINKKIYARDCKIVELDEDTAYNFFLENHIADTPVISKTFALVYGDEIVSAISVGKARFGLNGYEIYRFTNKNGITTVGGLGKLVKHIVNSLKVKVLFSYVDLRIFDGKGFENLGFELVKITKPDYFYTKDFINLIPRERFMKQKTGVNEREYVEKYGYKKIFGVGHALYKKEF